MEKAVERATNSKEQQHKSLLLLLLFLLTKGETKLQGLMTTERSRVAHRPRIQGSAKT